MPNSTWHRALSLGLLLFGASLPLSKSASSILLAALYLAAGVAAARDKDFRDQIVRNCRQPLTAAFALFCLVAYLGIIHTEKLADGFSVANKFPSLLAVYYFVAVLLQSDRSEESRRRKAESLLVSFLAGVTVLNLLGALTFLGVIGNAKFATPLTPLHLHHIWYSNLNALGLYTGVSLLLFSRHGRSATGRAALVCCLTLGGACILFSMSRAAWLGIALTAGVIATTMIKNRKKLALGMLLAVLACISVYRFVPIVRERIDHVARDLELYSSYKYSESPTGGRLLMWQAALQMFKERPLFGVGTGDFVHHMKILRMKSQLPKHVMGFNQPHNIYLFPLATNGIVGLAALLFIFYRILRFAVPPVRSDGGDKLFAFLAMAVAVHFMIAGLMDSFFNIQVLRFSFALIMGVCIRGSLGSGRASSPPQ